MASAQIPNITEQEIKEGLLAADKATRRRHPKILHQPGAEFNEVFNFMMSDSYMQTHLHPGPEKIETIYLVQGKLAAFFFNDDGSIAECTILEKGGTELIEVPAFTWHTYVMLSDTVVTYETMMGKYEPQTWKEFSIIAPPENSAEGRAYMNMLKEEASKRIQDGNTRK